MNVSNNKDKKARLLKLTLTGLFDLFSRIHLVVVYFQNEVFAVSFSMICPQGKIVESRDII